MPVITCGCGERLGTITIQNGDEQQLMQLIASAGNCRNCDLQKRSIPLPWQWLVIDTDVINGVAAQALASIRFVVRGVWESIYQGEEGNVTISMFPAEDGVLGGTLTKPLTNGMVEFSDLTISTAGTWTLIATCDNSKIWMGSSQPIVVTS